MNPLSILEIVAALLVIACGLSAINKMSHETNHLIRAVWLAITAGAAALVLSDGPPSIAQVVFDWAVAALVLVDRRQHFGKRANANP